MKNSSVKHLFSQEHNINKDRIEVVLEYVSVDQAYTYSVAVPDGEDTVRYEVTIKSSRCT